MARFDRIGTLLAAAAGAWWAGSQPALAQRAGEVTVEVGDCLEIEAPAERLACFERRVDEARGRRQAPPAAPPPAAPPPPVTTPAARAPAATPPAPAAATAPAPAARAPAPADDDSFGLSSSPSRRDARAAREAEEEERTELTAKVVAVRETIPNNLTITLDNGQIWRQNRPEFYPLRAGYEVRIYPWKGGKSYRLTAPFLRNWIQVERVR
jgi:hypothetical protein